MLFVHVPLLNMIAGTLRRKNGSDEGESKYQEGVFQDLFMVCIGKH
jgi:hypothetical protein